jgi:hypothetical protein
MQGSNTIVVAGVVMALGLFSTANATIVYDTAGTYLIDNVVNDNVLTDNSNVHVVVGNGGVIRGVDGPDPGAFPGAIRTRRGNLDVVGNGRIVAAPNQSAISMSGAGSVVRLRDRASVVGDITSLFTLPGYDDEKTALGRLYVEDQAVVNGNLIYANFVRIQDQALIHGDVQGAFNATMTLDMRGGTVAGALRLGGLDDHRVNMSGGSILGGFRGLPSYVEMTMTGGYIDQGFRTIGNLDAEFFDGRIDGGISLLPNSIGSSELDIFGGIYDTYDGEWLLAFSDTHTFGGTGQFSNLNIFGGQFGYASAGDGFFIDEWVNFSIHGRDLVYSNGWLTGYLQDGSWFSNALTFGNNWHGSFTIHNVPEPGTWGMFVACLIGLRLARRRSAS